MRSALLAAGIVSIGLASCGFEEDARTTPIGDMVGTSTTTSTTTTTTILPTTTTLNPLLMSCVEFVQFKAYVGDAWWLQVWFDVDESESALGEWCAEFSEKDPAGYALMNTEYQAIVSYLAGGQMPMMTTTTLAEVLAPPPITEPTTIPPPATETVPSEPVPTEPPPPPSTDPPPTAPATPPATAPPPTAPPPVVSTA